MRSRVHALAYIPAVTLFMLTMMPMGISALATTELALTNKRIVGRVRKQHLIIAFQDVDTVVIRRGLLGLFFNYGSITVRGSGLSVRFPGITKPADMKAMIDEAVNEALFGDVAKADLTPQEALKKLPLRPAKPEKPKPPATTPEEQAPRPAAKYKDPNSW